MYRLAKSLTKKSSVGQLLKSDGDHSVRNFGGVNYTDPSKRNWDPRKIYPNEKGKVRVTGITLRDGHQSLNGGMHRIDLLGKAAAAINKIRPSDMEFPGHEEIGGGTVVDFPLRFKGENPFRNMEVISSKLTHTPTSCLIRSDSLCGYSVNPRDVVKAFLTRYAQCGLDIFRIFDAYNNVSNHATGAEAVIETGKHYQAAITFTSHSDPTLFNVRWVADIAKEFGKLGAHSICIKDMAGIASPALMKAWVSEIKDAVPELPVVIHAHYTTGFSPITYLMAIEAGASAVDCGISTLSGRSGHPAMEVFNQVLADMGYDLGWDPAKALEGMKEAADIYREFHPRYEFCEMKMAGSVDYRVFTQGIPGGQISIMRNELVKNKLGHLFDKVIEQIQRVRTQAGGVALVTPTSEHVARQAIVNAMNGQHETTDKSPLWPGYSEMLRGVMGKPPGEMQVDLQLRALREWTEAAVKKLQLADDDVKQALLRKVTQIVDYMWSLSFPIQEKQIMEELIQRIRQCRELNGRKSFIANQKYHFDERIKQFEKHLEEVRKNVPSNIADLDKQYVDILKGTPDTKTYEQLLNGTGLKDLVDSKKLSREQFIEVVKAASFCTVCPSSILPNGMEKARTEVEQLAVQHSFEYIPPRGSVEFEEWAILQCMFRHSQNIALYWFQHHQTNIAFWDKFYPKDFPFDRKVSAVKPVPPTMYPYRSRVPANKWNKEKLTVEWSATELKRVLQQDIDHLHSLNQQLKEIKARKAENEYRKIINERDTQRAQKRIDDLEKKIRARLKTSLYATRPHEAGYDIDVVTSIETNLKKTESLAR